MGHLTVYSPMKTDSQKICQPLEGRAQDNVLIIFQALAMAAATPTEVHQPPRFDTDYAPVGIDNRCSACISHCIEDFVDTPRLSNQVIKGFGGSRTAEVMTGTICWK